MRKVIIILVFTIISQCKINEERIIGIYKSSCWLQGENELELELKSNGEFNYERAYLGIGQKIGGQWEIKDDTLKLKSWFFTEEFRQKYSEENNLDLSLVPVAKYTSANGDLDIFLIKGNKLLRLGETGFEMDCHLLMKKI